MNKYSVVHSSLDTRHSLSTCLFFDSGGVITESCPGSAKSSQRITVPNAPPGGTPGITGQGQMSVDIIMISLDLGKSVQTFDGLN